MSIICFKVTVVADVGIYFSEHAKTCLHYAGEAKCLLVSLVCVENTFVCPLPSTSKNPYHGKDCVEGYDSHYSPEKFELVIFNLKQILPCVKLNMSHPANTKDFDKGDYDD